MVFKIPESIVDLYFYGDNHGRPEYIIYQVKQHLIKNAAIILCGDVGFGKTEVAIRGAYKAVSNGKQVAYLVPTTVLANQQYESFKERMESFAIKVEVLNRFRTKKQLQSTNIVLRLSLIEDHNYSFYKIDTSKTYSETDFTLVETTECE